MYTPQWYMALYLQIGISVLGLLFAILVLRTGTLTALLAVLLVNCIPIARPPMFLTGLYVHDFLVPVFLALAYFSGRWRGRLGWFAVFAAVVILLWPLTGTVASILTNPTYTWITFCFRRLGALALLLVGLRGAFGDRVQISDFMDASMFMWVCLCVIGVAQQMFALVDTNFVRELAHFQAGRTIQQTGQQAQRSFMGMERMSVAIFGSAFAAYALAMLLLGRRLGTVRSILHAVTVALSWTAVFLTGSRGGLLACAVGTAYVLYRCLRQVGMLNVTRAALLGLVAVAVAVYLIVPVFGAASERFGQTEWSDSIQVRLTIWRWVLNHGIGDKQNLLLGMGGGTDRLMLVRSGWIPHAHNGFLQIMWESGPIGSIVYIVMLAIIFLKLRPVIAGRYAIVNIGARGMFLAGMVMTMTEGFLLDTRPRAYMASSYFILVYAMLVCWTTQMQQDFADEEWPDYARSEEEGEQPAYAPVGTSAAGA